VLGKDLERNVLKVGQGYHHPKLYGTHAYASEMNVIEPSQSFIDQTCTAKFRHRQKDVKVLVESTEQGIKITFLEKVRAVTPGQAVVFYQGEVCLGGAFIDAVYQGEEQLHV